MENDLNFFIETKELLNKYKLLAKKRLGQNLDYSVLMKKHETIYNQNPLSPLILWKRILTRYMSE